MLACTISLGWSRSMLFAESTMLVFSRDGSLIYLDILGYGLWSIFNAKSKNSIDMVTVHGSRYNWCVGFYQLELKYMFYPPKKTHFVHLTSVNPLIHTPNLQQTALKITEANH